MSRNLPAGPHEAERYELGEKRQHIFEVDRRTFFKALGAGLAVYAVVPGEALAQQGEPGRGARRGEEMPQQISVWLPARIAGQPPVWASVGPSGKRRSNQTRTAG